MNWEERIRSSDAGRLMPEKADEIIAKGKEKPEPIVDNRVFGKEYA
jgi:hypothetical protein